MKHPISWIILALFVFLAIPEIAGVVNNTDIPKGDFWRYRAAMVAVFAIICEYVYKGVIKV